MTSTLDIPATSLDMLLGYLSSYIPGAAIWAYGSRVKGNARRNSDLDLVAFTTPAQQDKVYELRDALDESDIPFIVQLHIWDELPPEFHENIRDQHVVLVEGDTSDEQEIAP